MFRIASFVLVLMLAITGSADPVQGISARGGLSGYSRLQGTELMPTGFLRLQGRLLHISMDNSGGSYLLLPVTAAWGFYPDMEAALELPVYLDGPGSEEDLLGDITAGFAWLYETARGGSSLVLSSHLRLPTGMEGRDRGTELDVGIATGTTFRLLRLQAYAAYVISGGRDPFEGSLTDYMSFSLGGASYVGEDIQVTWAMDGTTLGDLGLGCSCLYYLMDDMTLFGDVHAGMSGGESYSLSAGVAWNGGGF